MWNWKQEDWPNFSYDIKALVDFEAQFLRRTECEKIHGHDIGSPDNSHP